MTCTVKITRKRKRRRRTDGNPLSRKGNVGAQLNVLACVIRSARDLLLEITQTRLTRNEVRIALRTCAARKSGDGLAQRFIRRVDDSGGAFRCAGDGINAVGAVVLLDRVENSHGACPVCGRFAFARCLNAAYDDISILLFKGNCDIHLSLEALRRACIRSGCAAAIHLRGMRRYGQKAQHHDRGKQQRQELCCLGSCFHVSSFLFIHIS